MVKKYYKYMPFGAHTRLSLYMLFKENSVFFSDKKVLNDPTDCNPTIHIDSSEAHIRAYAERIIYEDMEIYPINIKDTAKYILEDTDSQPSPSKNWGAFLFYSENLDKIKNGESIYTLLARAIVDFHIEEAKVFSLSRTPIEPRMWAHYADSHKGICIEFEIDENKLNKYRIGDVEYTTRRPTILSTEIMSIPSGSDNAAKTLLFNKMFLTKSNGWSYEAESRLYIPKSEETSGIVTLNLPEGEYRRVSSAKITSIIDGLNINEENSNLVRSMALLSKGHNNITYKKIKLKNNSYDLEDYIPDDEFPF